MDTMASAFLATAAVTASQCVDSGVAPDPTKAILVSEQHRPFQCGLCSISFSVNRELVAHVSAHFINKPYQCGLCKVSYQSNPDLLSHVQVHHVFLYVPVNTSSPSVSVCSSSVSQCGDKDVVGQDKASLNSDVGRTEDRRKEGQKHERCSALVVGTLSSDCGHPSETVSSLGNVTTEASVCEGAVSSWSRTDDYEKHSGKTHNVVDSDGECDQDSDGLGADCWDSAPVKTERCDSQAVSWASTPELAAHCDNTGVEGKRGPGSVKNYRSERKGVHVCPVCDHHSDSHNNLRVHLHSSHTVDGSLKCPACEKTFRVLCSLKKHYEVHHEGREVRPHKCDQCDKKFKQLHHLKDHLQRVHGRKVKRQRVSGNCPVCPQQFQSLAELKAHIHSKHAVSGRFQCPVCEKFFKAACGLKKHYKLCHEEADRRLHQCHECSKTFKLKHHLRDHMQVVHGDEVKAKNSAGDCPLCLLHFESRKEVQAHLQSKHTVDGNLQCPDCEKVFKDLRILKRHHKVYHVTGRSSADLIQTTAVTSSPHIAEEGSEDSQKHNDDDVDDGIDGNEMGSNNEEGFVINSDTDKNCHDSSEQTSVLCLPMKEEFNGNETAPGPGFPDLSVPCNSIGGVGKVVPRSADSHKLERKGACVCPVRDHHCDSHSALREHLHSSHTVDGCLKCPVCEKTFPELHGLKRHFEVCHEQAEARPHGCTECGKKFKLPHHLKGHLQGVHGQQIRTVKVSGGCPVCPEQFQTQEEVRAHVHSAHTVNGNFQCPACEKAFRELRGLKQHYKVCHAEADVRPHQCEECEWKFKSPHHLKDHLQAVHGHGERQARLSCSLCEKTFKNQRCLKWHHKFCHEEADVRPHSCPQCGNKFKMLHHLKDHMQAIHGQPVQRGRPRGDCPVCPLRFENQTEFKAHMHSAHTVNGRFECPVCKKTLRDTHSLRYHYNVCHVQAEVRPHECQQCGQKFKGSHHLKDHIKTVHEQVKRRSMCHICGKTVSTVSVHMATVHSDARPYKCNFCDLTFKIKTCLNVHLKTHTKEKPFVCETCGKSFARNRTLAFHRNTHTNAKPFTCDICHMGFNSYPGMRQHKRRHTGDKPYACDVCGKKFSSSNNCHRHALTHTDQRPWACDKCGKTYRCRSSLQYHKAHSHMT